jgi:predicted Zn-dependent protease
MPIDSPRALVAAFAVAFLSLTASHVHAAARSPQQRKQVSRAVARRPAIRKAGSAALRSRALVKTRKPIRTKAPKRIARKPVRTGKTAAVRRRGRGASTTGGVWSLPIAHGFYTQVASPAQALVADIIGSIAKYGLRPKEQNPFTGELQTVALSQQEEILLGRRLVAEMLPTMGVPLPGSRMESYLDGIVQRLVSSSGIDRTTPYRFKVNLVHSDMVNAFAAPGGAITVTTGLLRQMKSEAHIALILAHEIGHVVARHGSQNMAREELVADLLTSLGLAAGGDPTAQIAVLQGAAELKSVLLSFSREHEHQSDALGVRILARAGYSGIGIEETAAHFIEHEMVHGAGNPAESDHPGAAERTSKLMATAREVGLTRAGDHGADRFAVNVTLPLALGVF